MIRADLTMAGTVLEAEAFRLGGPALLDQMHDTAAQLVDTFHPWDGEGYEPMPRAWFYTAAGAWVLEQARAERETRPARAVVRFARIGRQHSAPPLEVWAPLTPNAVTLVADRIHRYAGRFLGSTDYEVALDFQPDAGIGAGTIGWGRMGSFTLTAPGVPA